MSAATRLSGRITRLAVGRHLPRRSVRLRLTLLYGGLFLISGVALLAVTFVLVDNDTGVILTSGDGSVAEFHSGQLMNFASRIPESDIRLHRLSKPSPGKALTQFQRAQHSLAPESDQEHRQILENLGIESGIALAVMVLVSLGVGWIIAGRVLQPLEDSYEAQRQFVANASHELRTPLARQRALIQVALADPEADADSLRLAHERVLTSEQRLGDMIDALLTLTRGQAGLGQREIVDLATVTTEALLARASDVSALELEVDATLSAAPAMGDARLVERLIANLLDNAIRHNALGGSVDVTTEVRDRHALLSVSNTGPTVPPEEIDRLFRPFQRLRGNRTEHNAGHGLGLSIVQAIADAHGAELVARAQPDGGLHIEVSFPPTIRGGPAQALAASGS
jgi:signal transduction histidine kinase